MLNKKLNICIIEPFFSGSHKQWCEEYQKHTKHNIEILSLKGVYWKWRMHGGALTLAKKFNNLYLDKFPDLIITSDMLNLPVFYSFTNIKCPIVTFFHENQLTYPWSTKDRDKIKGRDHHYGFINYTTALKSDLNLFNSKFHLKSFIEALQFFLNQFPDNKNKSSIKQIASKSLVTYLGIDYNKFDKYKLKQKNNIPTILWNHRWEYDKNPKSFFNCLKKLKKNNVKFNLVIVGEEFKTEMPEFVEARKTFKTEILHIGYCKSFKDYARWLWKSDILPVTSIQDFFGISIVEAAYCNVTPILPNRLSYNELFKDAPSLFYNDEDQLYNKITQFINKPINNKYYKKCITNFSWEKIALKYDNLFVETEKNYIKNKNPI